MALAEKDAISLMNLLFQQVTSNGGDMSNESRSLADWLNDELDDLSRHKKEEEGE